MAPCWHHGNSVNCQQFYDADVRGLWNFRKRYTICFTSCILMHCWIWDQWLKHKIWWRHMQQRWGSSMYFTFQNISEIKNHQDEWVGLQENNQGFPIVFRMTPGGFLQVCHPSAPTFGYSLRHAWRRGWLLIRGSPMGKVNQSKHLKNGWQ